MGENRSRKNVLCSGKSYHLRSVIVESRSNCLLPSRRQCFDSGYRIDARFQQFSQLCRCIFMIPNEANCTGKLFKHRRPTGHTLVTLLSIHSLSETCGSRMQQPDAFDSDQTALHRVCTDDGHFASLCYTDHYELHTHSTVPLQLLTLNCSTVRFSSVKYKTSHTKKHKIHNTFSEHAMGKRSGTHTNRARCCFSQKKKRKPQQCTVKV